MPAAGLWPVPCAGRVVFSAADAEDNYPFEYVCKADPADPFCDR